MAKIKKDELSRLNELVKLINDIKIKIGDLELRKTEFLVMYESASKELDAAREKLKSSYGDINVNLSTGEYEVIKEE